MEIAGLLLVLCGLILWGIRRSRRIRCPYCGFQGQGKVDGPDGCLLILLFCIGVVPGVIYLFLAGPSGLHCPQCGCRIR